MHHSLHLLPALQRRAGQHHLGAAVEAEPLSQLRQLRLLQQVRLVQDLVVA